MKNTTQNEIRQEIKVSDVSVWSGFTQDFKSFS